MAYKRVLHTLQFGGNLFEATNYINRQYPMLVPYVLQLVHTPGHSTTIVTLRLPERVREVFRKKSIL